MTGEPKMKYLEGRISPIACRHWSIALAVSCPGAAGKGSNGEVTGQSVKHANLVGVPLVSVASAMVPGGGSTLKGTGSVAIGRALEETCERLARVADFDDTSDKIWADKRFIL